MALTTPTSAWPLQVAFWKIVAACAEQSMGPAKTFPAACSVSAPMPAVMETQTPVKSGFDPTAACRMLCPGSATVPRSISDRTLPLALASYEVR
jgi:hypothetical protein